MSIVFSWETQPRNILVNPSAELQRTTWYIEDIKILSNIQTHVTESLSPKILFFRFPPGRCGSVCPVTHLEAPRNSVFVHNGLHPQLLTLSVAHEAEIFPISEGILSSLTHRALRSKHLKYWFISVKYKITSNYRFLLTF